jgi:hypothetical protein
MFTATAQIDDHTKRVSDAAKKASFERLGHGAASIAKTAKASIEKSKEPSAVGSPPHTRGRGGHNLKGAIRFDANNIDAVIGPIASFIGQAGEAHEFGGDFKGEQFPERPFMGPALEASVDRFAAGWAGSIGE